MSGFTSFFIKSPVFSFVINILITVLGVVSFNKLSIREYPQVETPVISVSIENPGANARLMESQIANIVEEALSGVEGVDSMTTNISNGQCNLNLKFKAGRSVDAAANDVDAKIRRIRNDLPQNLREPVISKSDPNAIPMFRLCLYGGEYTSSELGDIMARYVKSEIEPISGVSSVIISGTSGSSLTTYAIDIFLKAPALAAAKVTPDEVYKAISSQSFASPSGEVILGSRSYNMTLSADLASIKDFGDVVVKEKDGKIIRVKDLADLKIQGDNRDQRSRYNGKVAATAYVRTQTTANMIEISREINKKLPRIIDSLPDKKLKLELALDNSKPIEESVNRVYRTIIEAIVLVSIVMLLFLKSFRSAFIPLVTLPICLSSGFFIIYVFGFTINLMTLLAMVLATGLVVDDAIVVLENISKKIEEGQTVFNAAVNGMEEIKFSIIAMTLTLVSVYAPISFASGMIGKMLVEFAVTLAGMVCVSGVVAFVLTPVMSRLILKEHDGNQYVLPPIVWFNDVFEVVENSYVESLKFFIKNSGIVITSAFIIFLSSLILAKYGLKQISSPEQDKNIISMSITLPANTNLTYIQPLLEKIETSILKNKNVRGLISNFSPTEQTTFDILLTDSTKRASCKKVLEEIKKPFVQDLRNLLINYSFGYDVFSSGGDRFSVDVRSSKSYDELEQVGQILSSVLGNMKEPYKVKDGVRVSNIAPDKQYEVKIKRDRANMLGIRFDDINYAIRYVMRGNPPATYYEKEGKRYPVRVWVSPKDREDPEIIKSFFVRSSRLTKNKEDKELVSLGSIVDIRETMVRPRIIHQDSLRAYTIYADFGEDVDYISAYNAFAEEAKKHIPESGYSVNPGYSVKKLLEDSGTLYFVCGIALIFIYLFMAAQFESFVDPLIVMCTVPLALSGALFSLFMFPNGSLNTWSIIGILTLIGLITKHGILLVDFFKIELNTSRTLTEAALKSASTRFRPIIMTTLAMVLGAVPLIFSKGSGSELTQQVGVVVVGGLTIGTLFTIFVVPCLCVLFKKFILHRVAKNSI